MSANPVNIGRIVEHGQNWTWFRLDRVPESLRSGCRLRVRPNLIEEYPDYPFRTGECMVLGVMGFCVHIETPGWQRVPAIADMDYVYLVNPGEKMTTRWVEPVVYEDLPTPVITTCPGYNGTVDLGPPLRPDGFDQRQVDAAKAVLLATAPPRYPRAR